MQGRLFIAIVQAWDCHKKWQHLPLILHYPAKSTHESMAFHPDVAKGSGHVRKGCKSSCQSLRYASTYYKLYRCLRYARTCSTNRLSILGYFLTRHGSVQDGVGHDFNATAAKPWIQAGQRLLELRELDAQQRHHMVMAESIDNVLDFIELDTLYDCRVPSSLARAQQSLQGYAGEIEQQGDAADEQDAQMSGLCGDVVAEADNAADVASQMYLQLHRLIAVETGLEITQLDVVALHYFRDLSHE